MISDPFDAWVVVGSNLGRVTPSEVSPHTMPWVYTIGLHSLQGKGTAEALSR